MTVKATHIDGDVSIGRNVSIGGKATLQGDLHVKGSVRVDGWLDARNIKTPSKGLFRTADQLKESYPEPRNGWWAIVGDSVPGDVYVAYNGSWSKTGQTGGSINLPGVDTGELADKVEQIDGKVDEIDGEVLGLKSKVDEIDRDVSSLREEVDSMDGGGIPVIDAVVAGYGIHVAQSSCLSDEGEVVYLSDLNMFAFLSNGIYYVSWRNVYNYMKTDLSGPIPNKIYAFEKQNYIYEDGELRLISASHPESSGDASGQTLKFHGYIDRDVFTDVLIGSSAEFDGNVYFIKNASLGDDNKNSPRKPIFANYHNGKYLASSSVLPEYIKPDEDGTYSIRTDRFFEFEGEIYVFNGAELLALSELNRITSFEAITDVGEISDSLPYANGDVVYIKEKRAFVNHSEGIYYRKWSAKDVYMDKATNLPYMNKFYSCRGELYIFNGSDMVSLMSGSGSSSESKQDELHPIFIGFVYERVLSRSSQYLATHQCSTTHETVIPDMVNDSDQKYLIVGIPYPYRLDFITSNGMSIPMSSVETQDYNGKACNVCYSVEPISIGAMENITIKIY